LVDADDDDGHRTLKHSGRHHSQELQSQGILDGDEAMEPAVTGARCRTRRLQYLLELEARDGLGGQRAGHAARSQSLEHGIRHDVFRSRPKWLTRCSPRARHTSSSAATYRAGSAVRTARSGICLSGPVKNVRVSGETRSAMRSANRPAAVRSRSAPYSAASSACVPAAVTRNATSSSASSSLSPILSAMSPSSVSSVRSGRSSCRPSAPTYHLPAKLSLDLDARLPYGPDHGTTEREGGGGDR